MLLKKKMLLFPKGFIPKDKLGSNLNILYDSVKYIYYSTFCYKISLIERAKIKSVFCMPNLQCFPRCVGISRQVLSLQSQGNEL